MTNLEQHPLYPGEGVPLFISAGPIKEASQLEPFMRIEDPLAAPVITSGGWTLPEWAGNATSKDPMDFVYYADRKLAGNARGLPNGGIEAMRKLKEPIRILTELGIKTIIQVTNLPKETPIDVIPIMVEAAAELRPTAVEVNLSCPNGLDDEGNLHPPTSDNPDASAAVMSSSRDRVGADVTLGAKDSPHASSLDSGVNRIAIVNLAKALSPYINFLVGINTIGGQEFPEITCAGGKGGASGPAVVPIAREWLLTARQGLDEHIPILSCGGVDSDNAGLEIQWRLDHGAMLVGGAQEFFRAHDQVRLSERWAQGFADSSST